MRERICSVRDCGKKVHARGLCGGHYGRALKAGEIEIVKPKGPLHRITNVNAELALGDCAVCGPATPVRVRPGRGHECQIRRKQGMAGRNRRIDRLKQYRLTPDDVERMRQNQGGRCAICQHPTEKLVVDHDHACCPKRKASCGQCVRGLLCQRCNVALGYWRDDPLLAIAAAEYLLK